MIGLNTEFRLGVLSGVLGVSIWQSVIYLVAPVPMIIPPDLKQMTVLNLGVCVVALRLVRRQRRVKSTSRP
jgi:hypothetical protein